MQPTGLTAQPVVGHPRFSPSGWPRSPFHRARACRFPLLVFQENAFEIEISPAVEFIDLHGSCAPSLRHHCEQPPLRRLQHQGDRNFRSETSSNRRRRLRASSFMTATTCTAGFCLYLERLLNDGGGMPGYLEHVALLASGRQLLRDACTEVPDRRGFR